MGTKKKEALVERCDWHKPNNLDYLSAHADAEERIARGERQVLCQDCHRWIWPDKWGRNPNRVLKGS